MIECELKPNSSHCPVLLSYWALEGGSKQEWGLQARPRMSLRGACRLMGPPNILQMHLCKWVSRLQTGEKKARLTQSLGESRMWASWDLQSWQGLVKACGGQRCKYWGPVWGGVLAACCTPIQWVLWTHPLQQLWSQTGYSNSLPLKQKLSRRLENVLPSAFL